SLRKPHQRRLTWASRTCSSRNPPTLERLLGFGFYPSSGTRGCARGGGGALDGSRALRQLVHVLHDLLPAAGDFGLVELSLDRVNDCLNNFGRSWIGLE